MKSNKAIATQLIKKLSKLLDNCSHPANREKLLEHIRSSLLQSNIRPGGEGVALGADKGNGIDSETLGKNRQWDSEAEAKNPKCELVTGETTTVASNAVSLAYTVELGVGADFGVTEWPDAFKAKETASMPVVEPKSDNEPVEAVVFRSCGNPRFVECCIGARRVSVFCGSRAYRRGAKVMIVRDGGTDGAPRYRVVGQDRV